MKPTHEDSRRSLTSFPEAKLIRAKTNCVIGKHWHEKKTEVFLLSDGVCEMFLSFSSGSKDVQLLIPMEIGKLYTIEPGTYHEFRLTKDSILVGLNSRVYDSTDDYRLEVPQGDLPHVSSETDT